MEIRLEELVIGLGTEFFEKTIRFLYLRLSLGLLKDNSILAVEKISDNAPKTASKDG